MQTHTKIFLRIAIFTLALTLPTVLSSADSPPSSQPATKPATTAPARATKTSKDGSLTLSLPANWKFVAPPMEGITLMAQSEDEQITVIPYPKTDFVDLEAFAEYANSSFENGYKKVKASEFSDLKINGMAALRSDVTCEDKQFRYGTVAIYIETPTQFLQICVMGARSKYNKSKETWPKLPEGLTENTKPAI